jgi:ribosomal protein L11 methyltransferase
MRRNGVDARLRVAMPGDDAAIGRFDIVLANILARPLIELAPRLCEAADAQASIALTGILEDQAADVRGAYAARVRSWEHRRRDGWVALIGRCA